MDIREIIKGRASQLGEKVYIVPNIPRNKLANTVSGITGHQADANSVVAVLDITVFGACDNGLAFTEDAMYFKELFKKPVCIRYEDVASASVKGLVLKELTIYGHKGNIIQRIEAQEFKAAAAANILNAIVEARNEKLRAAEQAENVKMEQLGLDDFKKAREKIKNNAISLMAVGIILLFTGLWWWAGAAIIISIALLVKYSRDASILDEGMPVNVYCEDAKEIVQHVWVGALLVVGVFGVPYACSAGRRRLTAIRKAWEGINAIREEKIVTLYLQNFDDKNDKLARTFVHGYLDWQEAKGEIIRIHLDENIKYVFTCTYFKRVMARIDSLARSGIRVPRDKMIAGVKEIFNEEEQIIEALINTHASSIETYTFADGVYFVHGINDDNIRVCSTCNIAEIVDSGNAEKNGPYYCSDYCLETDKLCEKLIHDLRKERFQKEGIDAAAFGGTLNQILSSINYNKGNVAARSMTGHGVAAENANTRIDKILGKNAKVVGSDNAKDGADRLVNGVEIQSKYCQTAQKSVNAAFAQDGDGQYRYIDANGKAMQLEVPRNQYEEAVAEMRKKFHEGKLPPDIKSEADAEKLVRRGHLTYKQAQNICKFGTIESLAYDAYTGAVIGAAAGGISFVFTTALTYYKTRDLKKSLQVSVGAGLQTGGKAFAVYVLTAQVQRTEFVKAFMHQSVMDINFGAHGKFVERIGHGLDKMSGAKSGSFTKNANVAVKGAVVTAAATFAVTSAWEVGKLCCGRMSGMQCFKNIVVSGGGIASGTIGALIGGALMAPIPGGVFLGGLIGGAIGGMLGGSAAKAGMDKLIKDDSVMIMALVSDEFKLIAASFCVNQDEIKVAANELDKLISNSKNFVEDVYSKKQYRRHYIARLIRPIFIRVCMARPVLFQKDVTSAAIESAIIDIG